MPVLVQLEHWIAAEQQLFGFAAQSEIDPKKHALPELDARADAARGMHILQPQIFRIREDPAGIDESNDVKKAVERPPVLRVQDESITIAKTILAETAHGTYASGDGQHEEWNAVPGG